MDCSDPNTSLTVTTHTRVSSTFKRRESGSLIIASVAPPSITPGVSVERVSGGYCTEAPEMDSLPGTSIVTVMSKGPLLLSLG